MKLIKKQSVTTNNKKAKKNNSAKPIKPVVEKLEDVKKLVSCFRFIKLNWNIRIRNLE